MIVLHHTAMDSCQAALEHLRDPAAEVSAHYLIGERGEVWEMVPEEKRAWHAGAGSWGGVADVNSRSIGVELANTAEHPFPEAQMAALEALLRGAMDRWSIRPERVIAHSDMAPERKSDPGPRFDWRRLAMRGLSVWPDAAAPDPAAPDPAAPDAQAGFRAGATGFGYPADAHGDAVLRAFRMRFRPWASGPPDATDAALALDLAQRFPVDTAGSSR